MDPNARLPGMGRTFEDLTKLPPGIQLPEGVDRKDPKAWYVQSYTTADGRQFFEFYRRGQPLPEGQAPQDPVHATVEGPVNTEQAERFKKDQETAEKPTPTVSAPPTQPNIVTRNPDGSLATTPNPNYIPPATAKPQGSTTQIEGTPIAGGGFDNERPVMVTRGPDGAVLSSEPLTPAEMQEWRNQRERSRNPGGKTDAELRPGAGKPVRTYTGTDPATGKPATVTEYDDGSKTYDEVKPGAGKPVRSYTGTDPATGKPATVTEYDDGSKTYVESKPGAGKPVRTYAGTDPATGRPATVTEYDDGTKAYAESKPENRYREVRQDEESGRWWGLKPDGTWEEMQGGPGAGNTGPMGAPPNPRLEVGQIQNNLRQYRDELNRRHALPDGDPEKISTAQWTRLWNAAYQDASTSLAEQQAIQAEANQRVSQASNRLSAASTQFNNAANVVESQNRYLQPGSRAGGRAFAAALGLQQLTAAATGGYDTPPVTIRPTGIAALDQPPPSVARPPVEVPPAAPPAAPALPAPIFRPPPPVEGAVPAAAAPATAPAVGAAPAAPTPPPPTTAVPLAPGDEMVTVTDQWGNTMTIPRSKLDNRPGGTDDLTIVPAAGAPQSMSPQAPSWQNFAALAAPTAAPAVQPVMPVAMLRTEARNKVPWRLSNQEIQRYLDAGVDPEDLLAVPEMRVGA